MVVLDCLYLVFFAFCLFWRFVTFAFCQICILSRIRALLGLLHSRSDLLCCPLSPKFSIKSKYLHPLPRRQLFSHFKAVGRNWDPLLQKKVQYRDPPQNLILFRNMSEMKLSDNILLNHIYDDLTGGSKFNFFKKS